MKKLATYQNTKILQSPRIKIKIQGIILKMTDTKEKIISDLIYVLKTIGLSEDGISELQETLGINRFEIIETMSDDALLQVWFVDDNIKWLK